MTPNRASARTRSVQLLATILLPAALLFACEEHVRTCNTMVKPAVLVDVDEVDALSMLTYAFGEEDFRPCHSSGGPPHGNRQQFTCGYDRTGALRVRATLLDGEVRERAFTITGNYCGPTQAIEVTLQDLTVIQEGSGA